MSASALDTWRAARAEAPGPDLPEPEDGQEVLSVLVDDVVVGGVVITHNEQAGRSRGVLRTIETTLPEDAYAEWGAVLAAIEGHVRARGAQTVVTAVAPGLAGAFRRAGYRATMTMVSKRLDPDSAPEHQHDQRVSARPMEPDERRRFAAEVMTFLRAGMERAGVLSGTGANLDELEERVRHLADADPPAGELLMMGLVDGVPIGRAWATLVTAEDGATDFYGNTIDLFPEFRGQGLTRSFLGALRRHVKELGVRDVHLRVYAHDTEARRTFIESGAGVDDVHLRKDLDPA
jgi:GNAT superfamily N-acetyltransferase